MDKITWENILDKCCWHIDYTRIELYRDYIAKLTGDRDMVILNRQLHKMYGENIRKMIENKGYKKTGVYTYAK